VIRHNRWRSWAGWLALWALLWQALAPALAHAVAPADSARAQRIEICSSTGVISVDLADDRTDEGKGPASATRWHCDWCPLSAGHIGLLADELSLPLASAGTQAVPAPLTLPPHDQHWRPAAARAPPLR
jgi:hypothetical protein